MAAASRARPSGATATSAAPATTATGNAYSWKTPRSRGLTLAIASAAFSRAVAIASLALSRAVAIASPAPPRAVAIASLALSRAVALASPTRAADGGASVKRRRACEACGYRATTYERVEADRLWVRKRGGGRQRFDLAKLRGSLARAAHKRPIALERLDELAEQVAAEVERA